MRLLRLSLWLCAALFVAAPIWVSRPGVPVTVRRQAGTEPGELLEEARRRYGPVPVLVETDRPPPLGPALLPAAAQAVATDSGYRPRDVAINDPSYDPFPAEPHNEPSIAVHGGNVLCGFNDWGVDAASPHPNPGLNYDAQGYSLSTDGGLTFQDQGKRVPLGPFSSFDADPVVAAGPDGDFYFLSDGGLGGRNFAGMAVSRATDGGRTFSDPGNAAAGVPHLTSDSFFDKGWLAVDTSSGPTRGNVYVTFSDFSFSARRAELWISRSTDRGASWSPQRLASVPYPIGVTYVQTAANGTVWAGLQEEGEVRDGRITGVNRVRTSTDGGATFGPPLEVGRYDAVGDPKATGICAHPDIFGGAIRYLNGPIEADSSLRLAVDPTDPTGATAVVVTHARPPDRAGDASDIHLWRTTDAGHTWTGPLRVNDDRTPNDQFMPDLWFAPVGTLGILWLDRRGDPANWRLEAWMAISHDGGRTFSCSFPVSSRAFPPVGGCQMSDYNGVFADGDRFYVAWGDGRVTDRVRQHVSGIYGGTVPLTGPGPILSLAGFEPVLGPDGLARELIAHLRNDGLEPATGLTLRLDLDGAPGLPVPLIPGCHGDVAVRLPVPGGGGNRVLKAAPDGAAEIASAKSPATRVTSRLVLSGPLGTAAFPVAFVRDAPAALGRLLFADFETASDFTPETGSFWHETSACAGRLPGHSGPRVAYFGVDASCTYFPGVHAHVYGGLVSRPVFIPGAARLRFREWVGLPGRNSGDFAGLQISTDGGTSFENLWGYGRMTRYSLDLATPLTESGRPTWHGVELDLSDFAGREVVLRFYFDGTGKPDFGGYAVDDVELVAVASAPAEGLGTCASPVAIGPGTGLVSPGTVVVRADAAVDPVVAPACAAPGEGAVWLELTPRQSGRLTLRLSCTGTFGTLGTSGTASLSAFRGPRCGPLEPAGCASAAVAAGAAACEAGGPALQLDAQEGVPLRLLLSGPVASYTLAAEEEEGPPIVIPIALDVVSGFGSYTTELALANPHAEPAAVTLTYTASLGERLGSGSAVETIEPRRQLRIPDVLAYLRGKGLAIPPASTGQQGGTLVITSSQPLSAMSKTLSPTRPPEPEGTASVALAGQPEGALFEGTALVFGLRRDGAARSKLALYSAADQPLSLRLTAYAGDGSGRSATVEESLALPPRGFAQLEDVLERAGLANAWVRVERVSGAGRFGAYGVVNDAITNDGSTLPAVAPEGARRVTVPILVETPAFESELLLAHPGEAPVTLTLNYRESISTPFTASATVTLAPRQQRIEPAALAFLRSLGIPIPVNILPGSYGGVLTVEAEGGGTVYAAGRTLSRSPTGGGYGVVTPALAPQELAGGETMLLVGLTQDAQTRTNVAVANAGGPGDGAIAVRLQPYDGATGEARPELTLELSPGAWIQSGDLLRSAGVSQGYVQAVRVSGTAPWLAYGVVNDGGAPGLRTGDGAYVPMMAMVPAR